MDVKKILSAMAISCYAILILAVVGSIVGFITVSIMVYTVVISFVVTGIWFFSS